MHVLCIYLPNFKSIAPETRKLCMLTLSAVPGSFWRVCEQAREERSKGYHTVSLTYIHVYSLYTASIPFPQAA